MIRIGAKNWTEVRKFLSKSYGIDFSYLHRYQDLIWYSGSRNGRNFTAETDWHSCWCGCGAMQEEWIVEDTADKSVVERLQILDKASCMRCADIIVGNDFLSEKQICELMKEIDDSITDVELIEGYNFDDEYDVYSIRFCRNGDEKFHELPILHYSGTNYLLTPLDWNLDWEAGLIFDFFDAPSNERICIDWQIGKSGMLVEQVNGRPIKPLKN